MSEQTTKIVLEVDADDAASIHAAIAKYQADDHEHCGELILPDGEGNLAGRIIGEICRCWAEYRDGWPTDQMGRPLQARKYMIDSEDHA